MKQVENLYIFKRLYDLSKWYMNHTAKFPKSHRFSMAVKIENNLLETIELITRANVQKNKVGNLIAADEKLLFLKILTRMSFEMKFINVGSYEYASKELVEIGKMLGAWLKQQKSLA